MPNKKITILLAMLVICSAGVLYAVKEYNRKPAGVENAYPDFTISANELITAFTADQANANQKFLGKTIQVSGSIIAIDKPDAKTLTIVLGEPGGSSGIRCSIDSTAQKSFSKTVNNQTSIKGICTGFIPDDMGLGADIILTNCIINEKK